jgi:hypothetical protein
MQPRTITALLGLLLIPAVLAAEPATDDGQPHPDDLAVREQLQQRLD